MTKAVADVLLAVLVPPVILIVIAGVYFAVRRVMMSGLARKLRKSLDR